MDKKFSVDFEVRSCELDFQGIVGNSNYLQYFDHARVKFLSHLGIDVEEMHAKFHTDMVLYKTSLSYFHPLKGGDHFFIETSASILGRVKILFHQELFKDRIKRNKATVCESAVVCVSHGKPVIPTAFQGALQAYYALAKS